MTIEIKPNLTYQDYAGKSLIRASDIKRAGKTAAHYFTKQEAPESRDGKLTALEFGTIIHDAVLENKHNYCVRPAGIDARTKAGKEALAQFTAENKGLRVIKADEAEAIAGITLNLKNDTEVQEAFNGCQFEVSVFNDEIGGMCRFDAINIGQGYAIDLKTCQDASPEGFAKDCANYGYHLQEAWYRGVYNRFDDDFKFYFIAVEKTAPYAFGIYELDSDAVKLGKNICLTRYRKILDWKKNKSTPVKSYGSKTIELPAWAYYQEA